jgi:hypothetical protein
MDPYTHTLDVRYFELCGRLWHLSNPDPEPQEHERLVRELMAARRAVRSVEDNPETPAIARAQVDAAKRALGERDPVWWSDGAPDYNRHLVRYTPLPVGFPHSA